MGIFTKALVCGLVGALAFGQEAQESPPEVYQLEGKERVEPAAAAAPAEVLEEVLAELIVENDRRYKGELEVGAEGGLALVAPQFRETAKVDLTAIRMIRRVDADGEPLIPEPTQLTLSAAIGRDVITLKRSQRVYGRILSWDVDSIGFLSERFGRLVIPKEEIGAVRYVSEAGAAGAAGSASWLNDWDGTEDASKKGTGIVLDRKHSVLKRSLPEGDGRISMDMTWIGPPEFRVRIGAPSNGKVEDATDAVYLQPWNGDLVLYAWSGGELSALSTGIKLKHDTGGAFRFDVVGDSLLVHSFQPGSGEGIQSETKLPLPLARGEAEVSIESLGRGLTIFRASAGPAADDRDEEGRLVIQRLLRASEVTGFNPSDRELSVQGERASFEASMGVQFLGATEADQLTLFTPDSGFGRVTAMDGEAIEVTAVDFKDGTWILTPRFTEDIVRLDLEDVAELRSGRIARPKKMVAGFEFRNAAGNVVVASLAGISMTDDKVFLERLEPGFETPIAEEVIGKMRVKRTSSSFFHASRRKFPHEVVLSNGETFPAKVIEITAASYRVETPVTDGVTELSRADVKAVLVEPRRARFLLADLKKKPVQADNFRGGFGRAAAPKKDPTSVTDARLDRALQVLRTQRKDPGTHLLLAKNGDLLRTNLVEISGDKLLVEGGAGGELEIPMDRLAAIVDIEPPPEDDESEPLEGAENEAEAGPEDQPEDDPKKPWVVVLNARTKLSMVPISADAEGLRFRHRVMGEVEIGMDEFDSLESETSFRPDLYPFMEWVSRPIKEPKIQ